MPTRKEAQLTSMENHGESPLLMLASVRRTKLTGQYGVTAGEMET